MRLTAISAGHTVSRAQFKGAVHSVFRAACNACLSDGALITFLTSDLGDLPQGVRVDTPAGFAFDARGLRPGQSVVCQDGIVRFESAPLSVDLRHAQVWRSDLGGLRVDWNRPGPRRAWQAARQSLQSHRAQDGAAIMGQDPLPARSIDRLRRASARLDAASASRAAATLVGLGPGLTPSGDDFLVGYLAGLWSAAGDDAGRRAFACALGASVCARVDRTNTVSRAFLRHAAEGRVSSALNSLARAIAEGAEVEKIQAAVRAALNVGHTSGADGVAGLLAGLAAWRTPS